MNGGGARSPVGTYIHTIVAVPGDPTPSLEGSTKGRMFQIAKDILTRPLTALRCVDPTSLKQTSSSGSGSEETLVRSLAPTGENRASSC